MKTASRASLRFLSWRRGTERAWLSARSMSKAWRARLTESFRLPRALTNRQQGSMVLPQKTFSSMHWHSRFRPALKRIVTTHLRLSRAFDGSKKNCRGAPRYLEFQKCHSDSIHLHDA